MAVIKGNFYAESLDKLTNYTALVPEKNYEEVAVLYLLHGRSGDAESWLNQTGIVRYIRELPLVVFCPEVDLSYYQNMTLGADYWTYLTQEFPGKMAQFHSYKVTKEFVAGCSMGGYGTLSWLLAEPQRFTAAGLLSPLVNPQSLLSVIPETEKELLASFGSIDLVHTKANLLNQLETISVLPPIYQSCGQADFLYQESVELKPLLASKSQDYEFHQGQGQHDWNEWDLEAQRLIERIGQYL